MSSDSEYVNKKIPGRVYFSTEFKVAGPLGGNPRGARYASRVLKAVDREHFADIKKEVVLRTTASGREQIKARFYVDNRQIETLTLQRFSTEEDLPRVAAYFTLRGDEIKQLLDLALLIRTAQFDGGDKVRLDAKDLQDFGLTPAAARSLLSADPKLISELVKHEVLESDVVAVAYRRKQLARFRQLLDDDAFFVSERKRLHAPGDEAVWQAFFEQNQWIFGYGLFYVFTSAFSNGKLERIVAGATVAAAGKRIDALLRTRGLVSSVCFAEIKTHRTPLLEGNPHRPHTWAPSRQLAEAISQVHKTVDGAERDLLRKLEPKDASGAPTGDVAYLMRPRSIVVVGSLAQFQTEKGLNEPQFGSFELFRRQLIAPEILTFDELYERARFIVEQGG